MSRIARNSGIILDIVLQEECRYTFLQSTMIARTDRLTFLKGPKGLDEDGSSKGIWSLQANAPLGLYSFDRREPRDHDVASIFSTVGSATRTYTKCEMSGEHRHSQWFQDTRSQVLSRELAQK